MNIAGCKIWEMESSFPVSDFPKITDCTTLCLCLKGEGCWRVNLVPYVMTESSLAIVLRGQILELTSLSEDFHALAISVDRDFVSSLGIKNNFQAFMSLSEHPLRTLTSSQREGVMLFLQMMKSVIDSDNPYSREIAAHLTCAMFYGLGFYFNQLADTPVQAVSRNHELLQRFLYEVRLHFRVQRQVRYYAGILCVSPGYLSTVVRRCSGKRAVEWINDCVIVEAKVLMRNSGKSIQQIATELGFPNQSFFGKFFKKNVGISPKEYISGTGSRP